MSKMIIAPALQELRAALNEADEITSRTEMTKRDEARLNFLLAKTKQLRDLPAAPSDNSVRWLKSFQRDGKPEARTITPLEAGTQTIAYSVGNEGGYLVPNEFADAVTIGMAAIDPLLDEAIVTLVKSSTFALQPYTVPGWDLSTFASRLSPENSVPSNYPAVPPSTSGIILNGYRYTAAIPVTFELEDDAFKPMVDLMTKAFTIGQARGIGSDLVVGSGTNAPQGIVAGAYASGVTTGALNTITETDINNIYFSVDAFYRNQPKCAWLMNDATYQLIRKAVDDQHRPLINVIGDKEVLMGKPVHVTPSLLGAGGKGIIFGDLAYYVVRVSSMIVSKRTQAPGYVEYGQALYVSHMRADAKVIDPTGGSKPPIVSAMLHS